MHCTDMCVFTIPCITRAFMWLRTRYDVLRRATAARGRRRRHRDSDRAAGAAGGWPPWCCGGRRRPSRKVRTRLQTASYIYIGAWVVPKYLRARVQLIRHFKICTTDIYLHNDCAHVGLSVHAPVSSRNCVDWHRKHSYRCGGSGLCCRCWCLRIDCIRICLL